MTRYSSASILLLLGAGLAFQGCGGSSMASKPGPTARYMDSPSSEGEAAGRPAAQQAPRDRVQSTTPVPNTPPPVIKTPVAKPVPAADKRERSKDLSNRTSRHDAPPAEAVPEPQEVISNSEGYQDYGVNAFTNPKRDRLSTFAIDVDTASYNIARRKLNGNRLPPKASVRVEEFVNFFNYDYPQPDDSSPFGVTFEAAPSPFDRDNLFLRVGVQGWDVPEDKRPAIHLTFLVDTSGSMRSADKIGLLKQSLKTLVENLREGDSVAIATYAGSVTKVLNPTDASNKTQINNAINNLTAGGSTAMNSGLELAYSMAYQNLRAGDVNRVIVCSDGDANIGPSSHQAILERIRHFTQEGVTLSTIGFGTGNYKDVMMEQLANNGNGNYYYIDTAKQARRVFQENLLGTLMVIAKDVKIQVEFDPASVAEYRLVGYENRDIADKDFRDDSVDAGEIGSGHNVTAIYELKLKRNSAQTPAIVRIRHKTPHGSKAAEATYAFTQQQINRSFENGSRSFRLAVAVAAFAEVLRDSPHARHWALGDILDLAQDAAHEDTEDEQELVQLIQRTINLMPSAQR